MTYTEDPAYEPVLRRDLEEVEGRMAELDKEIRALKVEVTSIQRVLRSIADQHI